MGHTADIGTNRGRKRHFAGPIYLSGGQSLNYWMTPLESRGCHVTRRHWQQAEVTTCQVTPTTGVSDKFETRSGVTDELGGGRGRAFEPSPRPTPLVLHTPRHRSLPSARPRQRLHSRRPRAVLKSQVTRIVVRVWVL